MERNHHTRFGLIGALLATTAACNVDFNPDEPAPTPDGPVAHSALEAWPEKPFVAPMKIEDMARTCVRWQACGFGKESINPALSSLQAFELCLGQLMFSAERSVPISPITSWPGGQA